MTESVDIDLLEYIRIVAKRKGMIVACTLVCLLLAVIVTANTTPIYEASAKLLVSQRQLISSSPAGQSSADAYQSVILSEKLANTFSQMLEGRVLAEEVIKELNLAIAPEDLSSKVTAAPIRDTQLIKITVTSTSPMRAMRIANALGNTFSKMVDDINPSSSGLTASVRVVEPAVKPEDPIKPKPAHNAILSIIIGLFASIGLAFLLERLDVSVKSSEGTERVTGLTSIGKIPFADSCKPSAGEDSDAIASEAYRSLRTNIQYLNFDQSAKAILVTSPWSSEGKTTLSANLAVVLAQAGHKVLLIDCDLRRPRLHEMFGLSNETGIANILANKSDIDLAANQSPVEKLYILTSGPIPPNPADLLDSAHMKAILKSARETFDFIIIDSPPVLAVTDAVILGGKVDGVILSSIFGKTNKRSMVSSKTSLEMVGARILGFVISGIKLNSGYGYKYGYGYGYGYGYYSHKAYVKSAEKQRKRLRFALPLILLAIVILFGIYMTIGSNAARFLLAAAP